MSNGRISIGKIVLLLLLLLLLPQVYWPVVHIKLLVNKQMEAIGILSHWPNIDLLQYCSWLKWYGNEMKHGKVKKLNLPFFPIDILLLVMREEEIVWHLGPHPILNTTCARVATKLHYLTQPRCKPRVHCIFCLWQHLVLELMNIGSVI